MADDEPWREAVRAAITGFTRVTLDDAIAHVRAALAAGASPAHAGDLALALGVARGDAAAARRFDELVGDELVTAARALGRDPAFIDEVSQQTRVRLLIGEGGAPPRIASYRGTGSLRAWVAIAAQRVALNARRDAPEGTSTDVLAELVDREPDPELRHLKTLYRAEFRDALVATLAGLPDRRRAILRLRFVDGLELAQIGRMYRVHESTVSRWIAAALEDIGAGTRERLVARLAITADTADSVARMVQSQLDLSIARLLQTR
jgi:RNA polymerase sigma-70 factor (ECF subfamily)